MKKRPMIKAEWIQLENELAEELLRSSREEREGKYAEVYEKMYSTLPPEIKSEMSRGYQESAIVKFKMVKK